MIPAFGKNSFLPPGIHWGEWEEIKTKLGFNAYRREMLKGLELGINELRDVGCKIIYIDGSFVSSKARPGDFDVCWDEVGVDIPKLKTTYPDLVSFANEREAQKKKYHGEFFPSTGIAVPFPRIMYLDFFQNIKHSNQKKGIIGLKI